MQSLSPKAHARQATLPTAFAARQVPPDFAGQSCEKSQVPHKYQSPREAGQRLHAIADRPNLLTPAISPQLGVASQ